ncbi:hypothetical protein [Mycetocola tolaasinivorans]|uniref:hypothetical protein n=1 Tax=Mycetocola tolaasinivorans TaxID=76635 RepID=UPI001FEA787E|nr:hypothetical protein [Mycetocola tolaasinivorans]
MTSTLLTTAPTIAPTSTLGTHSKGLTMNPIFAVTRLHLTRRIMTFGLPVIYVGVVALLSIMISLISWRAGSQPGSEGWIAGSQANPGLVWALGGFLGYMGVASTATTFRFAITLGSTRRSFTLGTLLWNLIVATYLAAVLTALTAIELLTDHWFIGFYIFDIFILGYGNLLITFVIVLLGTLTLLTVAGVFGAAWIRFSNRGPILLGIGIGLVLIVAILILIPQAAEIAAAFRPWWLAVAAGVMIILASLGSWRMLRRAIIR